MIDTHSHILYGIDDGSHTIEESLEILEDAYNNGVKDIVLTPHYIKNSKYNANNKQKKESSRQYIDCPDDLFLFCLCCDSGNSISSFFIEGLGEE